MSRALRAESAIADEAGPWLPKRVSFPLAAVVEKMRRLCQRCVELPSEFGGDGKKN